MKTRNIILVSVIAGMAMLLSGCGAFYGSEKQYQSGDWYWLADSSQVTRQLEDKLAFEKLRSQSQMTGSQNGIPQGFKGIVANLSRWRHVNTVIIGPERKSYFLAPGQQVVDYLIPGVYTAISYDGSMEIGRWNFRVGAQINNFMNTPCHWYTYYDQ